MTAAERDRIRSTVERTCAEQGIPLIVPAEVCAEVAAILRAGTATPEKAGEAA